jgi:O-antigen/teichoic acid export membrane protein
VGLAAASLVLSVLSGYNASLSAIQNGARQRAIVALHGAMDAWLKIFLALGVLLWLGNSSTAVVIGYALSTVFVTGSQLLFLRRLIPDSPSSDPTQTPWMQQMWAFSWPFSAWGLFTWTQQSSDRWALEAYASTHDVGRYSVLFQLGYAPISMATGLVMSFLGPILYQRAGDANDPARNTAVSQVAWRITFLSLLVTGIGFLLARGLHATVFKLLVSSQYQSVSYLLPWMVLAGGLFASGQMLSLKLMSAMKPAAMTIAKIVTALFGVLLNVYLASVAGLQGIVGAMVAFSLVYFAWMALLNLRAPLLQQAKG